MAHIFISYSRNEREIAGRLAQRLTEEGYDVWWDAALLGGTRFEDEITHVLKEARVAIILWSRSAAASDWVRAEAEIARHQKSALPVIVDAVDISALPILFQQLHTVELRDWNGNPDATGYQQILKAVVQRLGKQSANAEAVQPSRRTTAEAEARISRAADEQAAWAELSQAGDTADEDYRDFLRQFPDGQFAKIAQMRLKRLGRRSGKRQRTGWLLTAGIVALLAVAAFGLRGTLPQWLPGQAPGPRCAGASELVKSETLVPVSFCLDSQFWHKVPTVAAAGSALFFNSTDGMTLMASLGPFVVEPEIARSQIIISTDPAGVSKLLHESKRQLNGREWTIWEWTWSNASASANYQTYYASGTDIGSAQFTVYGPATELTLGHYGEPILNSVSFGKS